MPLPPQSVSSDWACSRTSRGRVAGPAAKLNTRTKAFWLKHGRDAQDGTKHDPRRLELFGRRLALRRCGWHRLRIRALGVAFGLQAFDALDAREALTVSQADQPHAL